MIRVEREEKGKNGQYRFTCAQYAVDASSREPLLDACRRLKSMGVSPAAEIALFRPGREEWDLRTTVGHGAGLTVSEPLCRYRAYSRWWQL